MRGGWVAVVAVGAWCVGGCGDAEGAAADGQVDVVDDTAVADTSEPSDTAADSGEGVDTAEADSAEPADTIATLDTGTGPTITTRTVEIGPFSVAAGVEQTMCATVDLGNVEPGVIRGLRTHLTAGSHHMIVHLLDGPADPTPRPCGAFSHGMGQQVLFIAQQRESGLAYPEGSGLPVAAHQSIGLELHFINYFAEDKVDITGGLEVDLAPAGSVADEVHVLFTGDLSFTIPAKGTYTETSWWPVSAGQRVLAMTTHTHQLGTYASIRVASGPSDTTGALLHESTSWSDPPLTEFDPLLTFDAGTGLLLTCEFDNPNAYPVHFGTGFEDEMCFMWLYYLQ